ncbi:SGNH/GDSL hydrolase family protein [Paenibacillus gansuensis]|uniref:SGNH/GDSL hydrolase family protein n=1 Tax=Paenibacillus gansuensis TaxID=306542 RepID=A0ABW5PEF7_9BACL
MKLAKSDTWVLIGDSITDCGRKHPQGEGLFDGIGKGYAALAEGLIHSFYPELGIRMINMGSSGHTIKDLKGRWETDVIQLKPDWVSILIGINDVWRQFDQPLIKESHVYIDEYESTLRSLVGRTSSQVKGIVLMAPFYLEPNKEDAMRAMMDRYGKAVKNIAEEYGALYVDTQAYMDRLMEHIYPATLAWDRVHPNFTGHMTIARALLDVLDFDWALRKANV